MKQILNQMYWMFALLLLTSSAFAWQWADLWRTADQQGTELLRAGKAQQAAQVFKNQDWQAVASYRAGKYAQALQRFKSQNTSDSQYNAGNAAAHLGHYQDAIHFYEKAIALNPHNADAVTNREIIKKLMDKKNQQNTSSSAKNSSSAENNDKKSTENKSASNSSSARENQAQDNSSQNNNAQTKTAQNNQQKDTNQNTPQSQQQTKHLPTSLDSTQEKVSSLATQGQSQAKEDRKQLLRRLTDDPGGLMQQKFLRDYIRRHSHDDGEGGI